MYKSLTSEKLLLFSGFFFLVLMFSSGIAYAQSPVVKMNWDKVIIRSKTTPTLQVVVNPMLKRGSPIHDRSFAALKNLGADYVRFVPWFPYPHGAVPELKPPAKTETFWDFSYIDPIVEDFMQATEGHSVIMNFSTIPGWMFVTNKPVEVPADPDQVFWSYNQGVRLRDTTLKELTDYYVRLFSWYTKGGFTDELGKYHKSGHHYTFQYWEVLNEPDLEHHISPQLYTKIYDAVVPALKKISPKTKFIGLALAYENSPEWFEYFLNPANHKPGIPLDGISYHFYARRMPQDKSVNDWQHSFFEQADNFLIKVNYIENIRKRLSPNTISDLNELGVILGDQTGKNMEDPVYWNLAGAMYAYLYVAMSRMGIDVAGESQLVGYPTQFPSVSMMNWINGKPNARYWVLKLLKDHFGPGDQLVETSINSGSVVAQAFLTTAGKKLLLINKTNKDIALKVEGGEPEKLSTVDVPGEEDTYVSLPLKEANITLHPFSVSVISFKN